MTEWMMKSLVVWYAAILITALIEGKGLLAIYWLGATILQIAVLLLAKGAHK